MKMKYSEKKYCLSLCRTWRGWNLRARGETQRDLLQQVIYSPISSLLFIDRQLFSIMSMLRKIDLMNLLSLIRGMVCNQITKFIDYLTNTHLSHSLQEKIKLQAESLEKNFCYFIKDQWSSQALNLLTNSKLLVTSKMRLSSYQWIAVTAERAHISGSWWKVLMEARSSQKLLLKRLLWIWAMQEVPLISKLEALRVIMVAKRKRGSQIVLLLRFKRLIIRMKPIHRLLLTITRLTKEVQAKIWNHPQH